MHSTGKIYVVIAVLVAIFFGIIGFLVYLERKLTKLESLIED
ncbi:CcmD family protein [Saprospiraceae bacterium]|nr:CcmD family protein [Saprospiraceae bacterium]